MPGYTEPLDPATPADSDLISAGDDAIRQKTRAIIERLSTYFVDLDANPLEAKNKPQILTGTVTILASQFPLTAGHTYEFDTTIVGAKAGAVAHAEWKPFDAGGGFYYPTPAGSAPITTGKTNDGFDLINFKAWVIEDDTVRVRAINSMGVGVGSGEDIDVLVWVVQS